jgi:hypothetical protein
LNKRHTISAPGGNPSERVALAFEYPVPVPGSSKWPPTAFCGRLGQRSALTGRVYNRHAPIKEITLAMHSSVEPNSFGHAGSVRSNSFDHSGQRPCSAGFIRPRKTKQRLCWAKLIRPRSASAVAWKSRKGCHPERLITPLARSIVKGGLHARRSLRAERSNLFFFFAFPLSSRACGPLTFRLPYGSHPSGMMGDRRQPLVFTVRNMRAGRSAWPNNQLHARAWSPRLP